MAGQISFEITDAQDLLGQLQQFDDTIRQDWAKVLNQWGNLKSVWRDQQFDRFEPLFDKLSSTYNDAERECEGYIAFLQDQIRIAEARQSRMGELKDL
jgi:hypothetical protein